MSPFGPPRLTDDVFAVLHDGAWHEVDVPQGDLFSVFCGAASTCVLVGHASQGTHDTSGWWNCDLASGLSGPGFVAPPGYGRRPPVVSCAGAAYCLAADGYINVFERQ